MPYTINVKGELSRRYKCMGNTHIQQLQGGIFLYLRRLYLQCQVVPTSERAERKLVVHSDMQQSIYLSNNINGAIGQGRSLNKYILERVSRNRDVVAERSEVYRLSYNSLDLPLINQILQFFGAQVLLCPLHFARARLSYWCIKFNNFF